MIRDLHFSGGMRRFSRMKSLLFVPAARPRPTLGSLLGEKSFANEEKDMRARCFYFFARQGDKFCRKLSKLESPKESETRRGSDNQLFVGKDFRMHKTAISAVMKPAKSIWLRLRTVPADKTPQRIMRIFNSVTQKLSWLSKNALKLPQYQYRTEY